MISRKRLLDVLLTALDEYNTNNKNEPIEMHFNSCIGKINIEKVTNNLEIYVNVKNYILLYTPDLLLGCDGAYSIVRKWILDNHTVPITINRQSGPENQAGTEPDNGGPKPVFLKELRSPSTGLNFKMLRIKSPFVIPDKNNSNNTNTTTPNTTTSASDVDSANTTNTTTAPTPATTDTTTTPMLSKDDDLYIFESAGKTSYERFRAVLFPQKHIEGTVCIVYVWCVCMRCTLCIIYTMLYYTILYYAILYYISYIPYTGEACERVCANVALPTHKLWQIKTFDEMKNFLTQVRDLYIIIIYTEI